MKGTVFEIEMSMRFENDPDIICLPNIKIWSRFLKRHTEIDRLIVTNWGIYCVEQKSYRDHLIGELGDENWIGITGRTTTKIYNPIMQNFEHIRSMQNEIYKIGHYYIPMENNVVVPDTCKIKSSSPLVYNMSNFINSVYSDSVSKPRLGFDTRQLVNFLKRVSVH